MQVEVALSFTREDMIRATLDKFESDHKIKVGDKYLVKDDGSLTLAPEICEAFASRLTPTKAKVAASPRSKKPTVEVNNEPAKA